MGFQGVIIGGKVPNYTQLPHVIQYVKFAWGSTLRHKFPIEILGQAGRVARPARKPLGTPAADFTADARQKGVAVR